jgi:hypothetical protein
MLVKNQAAEVRTLPQEEAYHDCHMKELPIREPQRAMDSLECKSASIGSMSPERLGMMGPKSSMT